MFLPYFSIVCVIIATTIYLYYKWAFSYWKKKCVPFVEPKIPFGNVQNVITSQQMYVGIHLKHGYDIFKDQGQVHGGSYLICSPRYIPVDLKIIKSILQQDFNYFTDRGFYYNEKDDPLSANLFSLGGERWRSLRSKLSPAFSSAKLKIMFDPLLVCADRLNDAIVNLESKGGIIDASTLSINYSISVIALCAFGVDCDCFKYPNSEFVQFGRRTFDYSSWLRRFKMTFAFAMPNLALLLGVKVFGRDYTNFFTEIVEKTISFRETTKTTRKDLIQLLIDLKNDVGGDLSEEERTHWQKGATLEELAAQVFIFFAAGFETSSTTFSFCLYELAQNLEIQSRLREEIEEVLIESRGSITYEAISNMKYANQVIEETLRKYPPVSFIGRKCERPYRIPGTDVVLDQGTYIDISILGIHHDREYYPDPEKFDPERFSDEGKKLRNLTAYLPFGVGPRICIGQRFAMMQLKVGLIAILQHYEIFLNARTKIPMEYEPYSFTLTPKENIILNIRRKET
ncbi:hypothetical protein PPYR_01585 [Photinus pyralis]|uniref:Cytochrome P450 n=1 Tax=Photinus pyralis TaxID=7054 RepID=A0A5N4B3V6_PHOPY|nr:probable cytochrome P450 6a14 [Photinus pyralis]XP_031332562.1 probable cytochrome P450 6a14 [Photinus pyralis]KAB0804297.1 hypothetical protein PPYR_01267 [Photinus pyralis]KAB0804615.1 hypothetical protein PPYR_01585 [Photinus pyralis]